MNEIYNLLLEKLDQVSLKLNEIKLDSNNQETGSILDNTPE